MMEHNIVADLNPDNDSSSELSSDEEDLLLKQIGGDMEAKKRDVIIKDDDFSPIKVYDEEGTPISPTSKS